MKQKSKSEDTNDCALEDSDVKRQRRDREEATVENTSWCNRYQTREKRVGDEATEEGTRGACEELRRNNKGGVSVQVL